MHRARRWPRLRESAGNLPLDQPGAVTAGSSWHLPGFTGVWDRESVQGGATFGAVCHRQFAE